MLHRSIVLLTLGLLVTGCTSAAQVAQRDEERCAARGLKPNTPEYKDCVISLGTEHELRRDARHRDMLERSSAPWAR